MDVQCMMSTLKDFVLFFKYSPKRQRLLESCVEIINCERISTEHLKGETVVRNSSRENSRNSKRCTQGLWNACPRYVTHSQELPGTRRL